MDNGVKQAKKRIYCAAYCRKSVEERPDETFGSIENQHEAILNFILSHKHEGWMALPERYDDNGFTGSNINRPSLQRLINDIKEGKVNMVVVYKLDRLSRSLSDFVQILKFFEEYGVAFASITQPIDTSTSTGKLMLHILSSFAEFERQLISERTKDKMSAARKRGQWTGGWAALGYDLDKESKKLVINETEAKLIKEIFDLYLKGNSLLGVAKILNDKGYRSKTITLKSGKTFGGKKFGITHIQSMIKNPLYIGKIKYEGQIYEGEQEAIIDEEIFKRAQEILKENRVERKATKNIDCTGLLSHLLHCKACSTFMIHTYTTKNKGALRYRYYLCSNAQKRGYSSCPTKSINAQAIENTMTDHLRRIFSDMKKIENHPHKQEIEALLSPIWDTLYPQEKRRIFKALVKEIDYNAANKKLGLILNGSDLRLEYDAEFKQVRFFNKWRKEIEIEKEPKIRKNLIMAFQLQNLLEKEKIEMKQAAKWLNLSYARLSQLLMLNFLSSEIKGTIMSWENEKLSYISDNSLRKIAAEIDWQKQRLMWQALISRLTQPK